jgi:hypothetical protein
VSDSRAFDWVCDRLEAETALNRLETRGTIRLVLRQAGLEPRSVSGEQLAVAIEKLLPKELQARSIAEAEAICRKLAEETRSLAISDSETAESPEDIFRRLAG